MYSLKHNLMLSPHSDLPLSGVIFKASKKHPSLQCIMTGTKIMSLLISQFYLCICLGLQRIENSLDLQLPAPVLPRKSVLLCNLHF